MQFYHTILPIYRWSYGHNLRLKAYRLLTIQQRGEKVNNNITSTQIRHKNLQSVYKG